MKKHTLVIAIIAFFLQSGRGFSQPRPDESLGLGIVELSMGREDVARQDFLKSRSINAKAMLERLDYPRKSSYVYQFDYTDPTFNGFYDYVVYVSKKPEYAFFKEIVKGIDQHNPNRDLGKLGIFGNALFSPRSTYLTIDCFIKTFILKSETGEVFQNYNTGSFAGYKDFDDINVKMLFSKDEVFLLKILTYERYAEVDKDWRALDSVFISYENLKTKNTVWKKEIKANHAEISENDSKIQVIENHLNASSFYCEIDIKSGKVVKKANLGKIDWYNFSRDSLFNAYIKRPVPQFDEEGSYSSNIEIISPNKKYMLKGNRTYGNFTLKTVKDDKIIREVLFGSDIE
jgi:hypothetical protein